MSYSEIVVVLCVVGITYELGRIAQELRGLRTFLEAVRAEKDKEDERNA